MRQKSNIFKIIAAFVLVQMNAQSNEDCIIIGYFAIRAKAQVCRLLCEYLGLVYRDQFFTPEEWENYQRTQAKDWVIRALPFLKHGSFVVTGQHGMLEYLVRKANALPLLGVSVKDRIRLDAFRGKHDIKDNIIALICQINRSNPKEKLQHSPQYYWETKFQPKLQEIEQSYQGEDWYLGYLSVADFSFYEMMNNLLWLFPNIANSFPKLTGLRDRVLSLEKVQAYEHSERAVKIFNPVFFYIEVTNAETRRQEIEAK